jgi:hypothetical protein
MERFIVVHGVKPGATQDELWETCHILSTTAVGGAKWLRSYFLPESDELICDWEAPDEAAVHQSLRAAGADEKAPVKHVDLAVYVDPEFFK